MMHRLVFALLLVSCGKSTPTSTATDAAPPPLAPVVDAAVEATAALSPDDDARRVVRAWSDALDKHDVDALGALYDVQVNFYTTPRTKAQVLAAKRAALGSSSTFHQQITGDIEISDGGAGMKIAVFTKRSGNGTKLVTSKAKLVVGGSPLLINAELDAVDGPRTCLDAVYGAVQALPAVKSAMDDVRKELPKYPDRGLGGIGPLVDDDGAVHGQDGVFHPDRLETIVFYEYSPAGVLEVQASGDPYTSDPKAASDKKHLIAASEIAKLKAACGH